MWSVNVLIVEDLKEERLKRALEQIFTLRENFGKSYSCSLEKKPVKIFANQNGSH